MKERSAIQSEVVRANERDDELFPVLSEDGRVIGSATRRECHGGSRLLHPVVHLHVFDRAGQLFVQQRPLWKDVQPGKWDTAVGGHVSFGETIEMALRRETKEEIGLESFTPYVLAEYIFESAREREYVHSFCTVTETNLFPSEELSDGKFFQEKDLEKKLGQGFFTPNFEREYNKYVRSFIAEWRESLHKIGENEQKMR